MGFLTVIMVLAAPLLVMAVPLIRGSIWFVLLFWLPPFVSTVMLWSIMGNGGEDGIRMAIKLLLATTTFSLALSAALVGLRITGTISKISRLREFLILFSSTVFAFMVAGALIVYKIWDA